MIISSSDGKMRLELEGNEAYILARFLEHAKFGGSPKPEIFTHPMMNEILRKVSLFLDTNGPDYRKLNTGMRIDDLMDATELDPHTKLMLAWLDAHRSELSAAEIADILFPYQP